MKKIIVILICIFAAGFAGIYTRPSYILIGQLNWLDVISKGYYVGSVARFFTQSMIDDSFMWVLKFVAGGFTTGLLVSFFVGDQKKKSQSKSKKKKA